MCSTYHIKPAAVYISYIGTCNEWMCIWEKPLLLTIVTKTCNFLA